MTRNSARTSILTAFLMERCYRYFVCSFLLHFVIYILAHVSFTAKECFEAFVLDTFLLMLAAIGTAKHKPLLIFPSLIVKFALLSTSVLMAMMCLGNISIRVRNMKDRMEFRRSRHYPEVMNILLEEHPSVCIWIYVFATLLTVDIGYTFKAFYGSCSCIGNDVKKDVEVTYSDCDRMATIDLQTPPPPYSVCVSSSSHLPTYSEALRSCRAQIALEPITPVHKSTELESPPPPLPRNIV
ncbi:unnamed protein product [Caenorhabditis bovis]|uniref:Uncharacterized protein n=1 Tax=Caenorhabditis bovis TaxID=2654633 RepID=A0A8S1E6G8_9PELO|nr:unnamed protein product [Caenorhabditis bovis]